MTVHNKIRVMREINQWSQEEMAEKMNMSLNGYARIERGETKLSLEKLEQIANIFNIDIVEFISEKKGGVFFLLNEKLDNINTNYYNGSDSIELEKLKIELKYKDDIIKQQQSEITALKEIINLLKNNQNS